MLLGCKDKIKFGNIQIYEDKKFPSTKIHIVSFVFITRIKIYIYLTNTYFFYSYLCSKF